MANTMTLIASSTVGSGGATAFDFTSIPQTYTDLRIDFSCRDNSGGVLGNIWWTINGTTTNYNERLLYTVNGGSATSASNTNTQAYFVFAYADQSGATSNTFSSGSIYLPNYTSSNQKSASTDTVTENNSSSGIILGLAASLWANTAAINRITLTAGSSASFVQYSTAYLYGVKNA
jgi:hypothetical protein